jgi:arsenate reductase
VTPSSKTRVLFICIGNSCRSQMAEGFARTYGADVTIPASAGLAPAFMVAPDTVRAMDEKNIDLRDHFPKSLKQLGRAQFDLFINMSGFDLPPGIDTAVRDWDVPDPIAEDYETHCQIRDEIEARVMGLILELRRAATSA